MVEEVLVPSTKVVQPRLAIRRRHEPVLGAFPVAGKADFALTTVLRQGIGFVAAELPLLRTGDHVGKGLAQHVAQLVLRVDVVVAGVEIPIVLDGQCDAALLTEHAQA